MHREETLRGLRSYEHTGPAMEQLSEPKASFAESQVINRVRVTANEQGTRDVCTEPCYTNMSV